MYYNIKRNNQTIASVVAEGTYTAQIMGEEVVNMSFTLSESVEFLIGDYVEIYGQSFVLNLAPEEEKISSIQFKYTLQFESVKYELGKIQLLFPDSSDTLSISDFSVMGDARRVLELIIQNANRVQNNWKLGIVDDTETKNFSFSAHNLLTALTMLADEFENEFWIDKNKTIHFTTKKEFSGLTLQYGIRKGLRSLYRSRVDSSNIVTRLFAYGSEKNISSEYRNYSKRLKMDVPYLEANVDKFGIIEHTEMFDDVYPNRKGKVTAINPENILQFTDDGLEFDLNSSDVLIPNTTIKVTFNTGQLAGYTLEVKELGFNFNTKTFELQPAEQEKAITVPSELMRPAVGDEYVLTDIIMPLQYVTEAEAELKRRSEEYLTANCLPRLQYNVVSDPFYFEAQNIDIVLGKTIKMIDADFNLDADIRVIGLTKNLQDQYDVSFDLADEVQVSRIVREYLDDQRWANQVITHQQKVDRNIRRNYQFTREIQDNIFDTDGYFDTDKIKPLSIDTKMLSVSARSQQFQIKDVQMSIVDNSTVRNTSGQMVHFTISDSERVWNILAAQINNISAVFNYIYLRCQREGNQASFLITTEQIKFDADPNFYHFEYGYLSSIMEGFRKIKTSYGFSTINGGEITSGKILGQNGDLFIDIDNRKVVGKIEFTSDSPAFNQVKDSIQISNRNLLLNSGIENDYTNGTQAYHLLSYITKDGKLLKGEEYTVLIDITTFENRTAQLWFINNNNVDNSGLNHVKNFNPENESKRKIRSFTFRAAENDSLNFGLNVYNYGYQSSENEKMNNRFILHKIALYKGNNAIDWTPAPEDIEASILQSKTDSINASKAYSDAQDELKRIQTEAYADGKVTAAEQRAIDDATNKAEAAKIYAKAQDDLLRTQLEAYADGQITAEEQQRIQQMQDNLTAAKAYADAQANLAKIAAAAYADGIVDEEEARAIADATAKMEAAKAHAQGLVNNIQIGGRNLFLNSKGRMPHVWGNGQVIKTSDGINFQNCTSYIAYGNVTPEPLKVGEEYTISIMYRTENTPATNFSWYLNNYNNYKSINSPDTFGYWKVISDTRRIETDGNVNLHLYVPHGTVTVAWIVITKGNKGVQDWIPAIEDVDSAINDVKIKAENALTQLTSIANDNILSPSEKQQVSNEWNRIKSEYVSNYSLGVSNGVDTTNFTNSYNDLYNFITPLLVDISADSPIVGDVFRTKFKAYYDQNIAIIVAVNEKLRSGISANSGAINRINQITSFLNTTINGNVIGTGVLMVGSESQSNAFISGLTDKGNESIRFAAGKPYQEKEKSPFQVLDNGLVRFCNPENGKVVFELGSKNGKVVFDIYNEQGLKTATIGPQGIVFTGYTPENYDKQRFRRLTYQSDNETELINEVLNYSNTLYNQYDGTYRHILNDAQTYAFQYSAGYNFESANNAQHEGKYFQNENKLGAFMQDGWYATYFENIIVQSPNVNIYCQIILINAGRIIKQYVVSETKPWSWFNIY
ncbi:phage tail protein [Empedobacter falsenii]